MFVDKIEAELQEFINTTQDDYALFRLYYSLKHREFDILKVFRDRIVNGKELCKQACEELYKTNKELLFDDFSLLKGLCELEKQNELPKLNDNENNKDVLLKHLLSAMDYNINLETTSFSEIIDVSNEYYDYILDFCSYIKNDIAYKNALNKIENNKIGISNEIVKKVKYHKDYAPVGYSTEDFIDWCDMALRFNPHNEEALCIKKGLLG